MGKSAKKKPRANPKSEEEPKSDSSLIILSSDGEADDDLSLKIVEKAMLRAAGNETTSNSSSSATQVKKKINKIKDKKKKKEQHQEKMGAQVNAVDDADTKEEGAAPKETDATLETDPSEKSDNIVLRKLLRGPRYFDPPDSSWGNCYNCGEAGHTTVNCTAAKRKKPCFVCGSLEHNAKQCIKAKDCFICKKGGHRAKDCPEKSNWGSKNTKICLKCGDSGHEMFTCKSQYSSDDLKEIQCYVCKCFGHLCCVNYAGEIPGEVSCYRCGQLGHSGWECARVHAETTSIGTLSSCFKCGEEGHMARKCTTSTKKEKRKREFSSPKKSRSKGKYGSHLGVKSVPPDLGNARKRNKTQFGQPSSSQPKPRGRGGWITEDPGDYDNNHGWGSPKTPAMVKSNDRFHGDSDYKSNGRFHGDNGYKLNDRFHGDSGYRSNDRFHGDSGYRSNDRLHGGGGGGGYRSEDRFHGGGGGYNPGFHGNGRNFQYESAVGSNGYQHRFSASRYGNSSSYGKREYSWDY